MVQSHWHNIGSDQHQAITLPNAMNKRMLLRKVSLRTREGCVGLFDYNESVLRTTAITCFQFYNNQVFLQLPKFESNNKRYRVKHFLEVPDNSHLDASVIRMRATKQQISSIAQGKCICYSLVQALKLRV